MKSENGTKGNYEIIHTGMTSKMQPENSQGPVA